jgi:signal peptidase
VTVALTASVIARRGLELALVALIGVVFVALVVARGVPLATGVPTLVVGGGSMDPAIRVGSVVIDEPVAAGRLAVGDVVSLKVGPQQAVFTHRITRVVERDGGLWIETKGDANRTIDPSLVPASAVIGRVAVVIPLLGYVVQMLGTLSGLGLLLMIGILTQVGAWALDLVEEEILDARRRRVPVGARLGDGWTEPGALG